jgi:hypothetical protein
MSPESSLTRLTAQAILTLFLLACPFARAQESRAPEQKPEEADERPLYFPEIEALFSSQFRTASIIVPVWHSLSLDTRYYGNDEANVGLVGASWTFKLWQRHIELSPGLSASFGSVEDLDSGFRTAPTASLRWDVKKSWFHAEGYSATSLIPSQRPKEAPDDEPYSKHAYLSDGNHISANWKRLEGGFAWEHIAVREDQEWKTGGRVSVALNRHFNFVAYILAPSPEFRCGLSFHPAEKD